MDTPQQDPTPSTHRSHRSLGRAGVAGLAAAAVLGVGGFAYAAGAASTSDASASSSRTAVLVPSQEGTQTQPGTGQQTPQQGQWPQAMPDGSSGTDGTDATTAQEKGLVYIDTTVDYGQGEAAGTGMVLTSDGTILTNHHVVEGATSISVQVVSTGKTYEADVVGYDATHDVAVLQLEDASGLDTVTTDTSGDLQVGDAITGVGNANGDGGAASAAAGTVTGLDQSITVGDEETGESTTLSGLIEVDADIISGDSGGALYDADGEVVGMNTAASSGSADVTGYAVPIAQALDVVEQIEQAAQSGSDTGDVTTTGSAFLGVELAQTGGGAGPGAADGTGGGAAQSTGGATIAGTVDDSPAAEAGLAQGDTITAVDGTAVSDADALVADVADHAPGDTITLAWTDASGASHTAQVTLTEGPVG